VGAEHLQRHSDDHGHRVVAGRVEAGVSILRDLFGPGTWGTGGNLVAWILCGAVAAGWLRAKLKAHEALARLHHQQAMDKADAARKIAADTYRHQTGREHELAKNESEGK
jgi:hypothetical protein